MIPDIVSTECGDFIRKLSTKINLQIILLLFKKLIYYSIYSFHYFLIDSEKHLK